MESLEKELDKIFKEISIEEEKKKSIDSLLSIIKNKDPEITYPHSLNLAINGYNVSRFLGLNPYVLTVAGLLHDVGKVGVDTEILTNFKPEDMKDMKHHPMMSYHIIKDIDLFIAEIVLRHHTFQKTIYPKNLPRPKLLPGAGSSEMVYFFSGILAFLDQYDAATERKNNKHGEEKKTLKGKEAKNLFIKYNPNMKRLVDELYRKGILGEVANDQGITNKVKEFIDKSSAQYMRNSDETKYSFKASCALRPAHFRGKKKEEFDKTYLDRFNAFMSDKLTIGTAFEEYTKKLLETEKQSSTIYGVAYESLLEFKDENPLWRIKHGLIELLLPIVTTQILHEKFKYPMMPLDDFFKKATEVMKNTSKDDITQLRAMRRKAYDLEGKENKEVPEYEVDNVYDYYAHDAENGSSSLYSKKLSEELSRGFPMLKIAYKDMINSDKEHINDKIDQVYPAMVEKRPKMPVFKADCVAASLYLMLSRNKI